MADSGYRGDQEIAPELTKLAKTITPVKSYDELLDELLDLYKKSLKVVAENDPRTQKVGQVRP
jgi:hypothetical protein